MAGTKSMSLLQRAKIQNFNGFAIYVNINHTILFPEGYYTLNPFI